MKSLGPVHAAHEGRVGIYVIYSVSRGGTRRRPLYVGKSVNPQERFRQHLAFGSQNKDLDFSLQLCISCGQGIAFEVVEWCDPGRAKERERHWILEQSKDRELCNVQHNPRLVWAN